MFAAVDFLVYCFVTAYTPGANNLLSMSNAARLGLRRSIWFNLGITAGFFVVVVLCTVCTATLYALLPAVQPVMHGLGAAYMFYLAWKVWRSQDHLAAGETGGDTGFAAGMLLQFMNPKIYIYAITAMSLYILPVFQGAGSIAFFVLLLTVIGASGSYVWALMGAALCRVFARHAKAAGLAMSLLLVYCGLSLF